MDEERPTEREEGERMTKLPPETLTKLLHDTFAKKRNWLHAIIRREYGAGNPPAFIDWVAERACVHSYEYYLKKLHDGAPSTFDDCLTEQDVLNRLKMKAKSNAIDLIRKKERSSIVHGILDAPRSEDEDGSTNLEYFEALSLTHGEDQVLEELTIREVAEKLSELSEDDRQFLERLIGAQVEGNYARPPFKAIAEELGVSPHKIKYRWKKLQAKIIYLIEENR